MSRNIPFTGSRPILRARYTPVVLKDTDFTFNMFKVRNMQLIPKTNDTFYLRNNTLYTISMTNNTGRKIMADIIVEEAGDVSYQKTFILEPGYEDYTPTLLFNDYYPTTISVDVRVNRNSPALLYNYKILPTVQYCDIDEAFDAAAAA